MYEILSKSVTNVCHYMPEILSRDWVTKVHAQEHNKSQFIPISKYGNIVKMIWMRKKHHTLWTLPCFYKLRNSQIMGPQERKWYAVKY